MGFMGRSGFNTDLYTELMAITNTLCIAEDCGMIRVIIASDASWTARVFAERCGAVPSLSCPGAKTSVLNVWLGLLEICSKIFLMFVLMILLVMF